MANWQVGQLSRAPRGDEYKSAVEALRPSVGDDANPDLINLKRRSEIRYRHFAIWLQAVATKSVVTKKAKCAALEIPGLINCLGRLPRCQLPNLGLKLGGPFLVSIENGDRFQALLFDPVRNLVGSAGND